MDVIIRDAERYTEVYDTQPDMFRVSEWAFSHWDDFQKVCGKKGRISKREYERLRIMLEQNSLYELLFVLITTYDLGIRKQLLSEQKKATAKG